MAADPPVWKYINARIQHKHDTATQWGLKPNFIPEAGEIIIYDADSTHDTRFKVGDGQTKISALPFVTGVTSVNGQTGDVSLTIPTVPSNVSSFANDAGYLTSETDPTVPSWAKASSKPSYTASEVGAIPTTRTVNGKALSSNISLTASDVSAVPTSSIADPYSLANDGILTEEGFDYATNEVAEEYQTEIPTVAQVGGMIFDVSNSLQDMIPTSASQVGASPSSHGHGNIQNGGTLQSTDVAIANGDKLVVTDASDSNKIARTSVSFDGSTTTKALTQKGTFETFLKSYTETDPTVPAWAKAASKPTYTASEVGALPSSTVIPSKTSDLTNDSGFLTSVSDMTGADGTNPGTHGLAPAPSATDNDKFLKGDGTWDTPPGSNIVVSCSSVSGTSTKSCTHENFTHEPGVYFTLVFENGNDHLNLSSLPIQLTFNDLELTLTLYINGVISSGTNCTYDAGTYLAYDDGTNIHIRTDGLIPTFVGSGSLASYMSDQEVIAILNGADGTWSIGDRLTILWQNASPSSRFTAQTITLSDSPTNYDFLFIIYNLANTTTTNQDAKIALPFPTSLSTGSLIHIGGSNNGGYRTFSVSGSTITFGSGDFNSLTSASKDDYLIPEYVIGVDLDKIGNVKETLATLWTNPSPTTSFAAQTITVQSMKDYDFIAILCSYDTSNSYRELTFIPGSIWVGKSVDMFAHINHIEANRTGGRRVSSTSETSVTFGTGYYNGTAGTSYAIPRAIYGINL